MRNDMWKNMGVMRKSEQLRFVKVSSEEAAETLLAETAETLVPTGYAKAQYQSCSPTVFEKPN